MFKNLFKNIAFGVFWLNYRLKEGTWGQNGKMGGGGILSIQGQTVKIPLQSPGKLSIFLVLSLVFHLSLPKIWQVHPHKIIFSKLTRTDLLLYKVQGFEVENCGHRKHLKLDDFLLHFYKKWQKSTWRFNGCHGYHANVISLILPF